MKRSLKDRAKENGASKICVPVREATIEEALKSIKEAGRFADLIELRADYLKKPELSALIAGRERPLIVTCRPRWEGGRYGRDEGRRFSILKEGIEAGAEYIDVEARSERSSVRDLMTHKRKTQIILSHHDYQGTPPLRELVGLMNRMKKMGGDVVKIVTFANAWEDNLAVLPLIPLAAKKGQKIVAFCMGGKGKFSRLFAPRLGSAWTYAVRREDRASAPGQMTITEMRAVWESVG